ncbi:trans-sulfuration enzyme family protein [Myroides marinus]|uniref:trans-sulfuration enzyme family protein n=1 Tax=Myroides marinus TaxID=703342 RepID=UPI0025753E26|nr:aminotransferase class I/II-fold pyridoxal phosphate-dependent enzyme [Myroides marinus]MDM1378444.1 aminotransferase class I/II-fold pyridoxal phosphate-dependent enzyme [Myroides marinus]MDM1385715.1 aminotransferase class I/II-fold pyridoxal phosphate-dependent enzyme [Myroides marinus]MDM1392928.1 aminotransferase class I/II-fold pyridoxal phosphate-dependent enzyme [Myroides marinus]
MSTTNNEEGCCFETQAIRTQTERTQYNEHSTPLYLTSSFVFDDAENMRAVFAEEVEQYSYSRFTNPNQTELVEKICLFEHAEAGYAFATGMAAVYCSLFPLLKAGDHIVSCSNIFGSTRGLFSSMFPEWGVDTSYFDLNQVYDVESLIKPNTKILFAESPTNPGVDVLDLAYLGEIAKKHNLIFIVDNTFATPYLQNPITLGAHIVIHSATKLIDGQGRVCGGVTVGYKEHIHKIYLFARTIGSSISPFNAWVLSKSLETLAVRVDRHCENALTIAEYLEQHPAVEFIKYPFLPSHPQYEIAKKQMKQGGNIIAFGIRGGLEAGRAFLNALQLCSRSANLGDSRTIVTHPASTTHSKVPAEEKIATGITDNLIRLSVGLENTKDIIRDLEQALTVAEQ